jgi:fatty-acyl-CoA synthase
LELGIDGFAGYSMSETCLILTVAHLKPHIEAWDIERQVKMRCKTGRPVSLVQMRIVDEEMNDLPHDGVSQGGRSRCVRPGLLKAISKIRSIPGKLWAGGWLHTGDAAVIDEEGYVKITERLKDVIKTGGEWVSSLDLEDLLLQHPEIIEASLGYRIRGGPSAAGGRGCRARVQGRRGRNQGASA